MRAWGTSMRVCLVVAAVALSGCAPTIEGSSPAGGIVKLNGSGERAAFELANSKCQSVGKVARVSGQDPLDGTLTFDCVTP